MSLSDYEAISELARHGPTVVVRARARSGREVAIKLLGRAAPREAVAQFERERRLHGLLAEDAGFVPLLEAGESEKGPYVVMPFLSGGTLRDRLRRGPLAIEETEDLARAVAVALRRAHERGVVHRDLKPANILFDDAGRPLIADLGLAKHFRADLPGASASKMLSRTGGFVGTPGYAAPEQLSDAKNVGPAADVFAFGAIIFECLTGKEAFPGPTVLEILENTVSGKPLPILERRPDAPAHLVELIRRCLATEVRERPADGVALARALQRTAPARPWKRFVLAGLALAVLGGGALALLPRGSPTGELKVTAAAPPTLDGLTASGYNDRAVARRGKHDLEGALSDFSQAIALDPGYAQAFANRGTVRVLMRDLEGAMADYTRALELDPKDRIALYNRGVGLQLRKDLDGAIADYDRLLAIDPRHVEAYDNRGEAYEEKGDLGRAIADYDRAIAIDPTSAKVFHYRGRARARTGDDAGAIRDYTRSIELDPKYGPVFNERGIALLRQRSHDAALSDLARAIELDPRNASFYVNRGIARQSNGDLDGALSDLGRAIELDPRLAEAYMNRGTVRQEKGDLAGAIADQDEAIRLDPNRPGPFKNRGLARWARGEMAGAASDFERVLALDPNDKDAPQLRAFIAENRRP
jgi:tetratricopeptide (TPR) repeat protein